MWNKGWQIGPAVKAHATSVLYNTSSQDGFTIFKWFLKIIFGKT